MNVRNLILDKAERFPQKPAIIFEDKEINFLRLKDDSFRFANYLINSGIKKGDKVAVFMPSIPETAASFLGVFSAAAVLVALDFMLTEEEAVNLLNHSGSKILIVQPKREINLSVLKDRCPALSEIITCQEKVEGFSFWDSILEKSSCDTPAVEVKEEDISSIFYTSGSTGHPKGVVLSYGHFDVPMRCLEHHLSLTPEIVVLCAGLPFSHLGGFNYILVVIYFGHTLILMKRFNPLEFLKNVERYRVNLVWMVPAMYVAILSLKDYGKFTFPGLKYVVVFGAPSSPGLLRKFHRICPGAHFINGWGMTETAAPSCFLPPGQEEIQSVGKFTPDMETKIVNERGETLGGGETGELWVRGKGVMLGYYKEPELTGEVLTNDGWLKTGDIARFDERQLCYIVGRKKDMIKVAGEVVFSAEIEEKIHRYPKVKEVAVVGVNDSLRGEVPKAFIVPKDNQAIDEQKLRNFLKEQMAYFKIPHYFEFLKDLPKNRTGKINKKLLKEEGVSL
jgi:long-chain acyl-CoA synthetase